MSLTKKQLIDAHEQGLSINTRNGNIKIVCILGDVYGVNHCDNNSKLVKWWMFENFERNEAKIEQTKPKYNGKAVKCDTVEQLRYIATKCNSIYLHAIEHNFKEGFNYYQLILDTYRYKEECEKEHIEIISFSQYCTENGINEPKWIQGFEVKDGYNDVVICSNDANYRTYSFDVLKTVYNHCNNTFCCIGNTWKYCRYPHKNEINEIKFVD
jgi:hypothetical protein